MTKVFGLVAVLVIVLTVVASNMAKSTPVNGYMVGAVVDHNGMTQDVHALCAFPDGSTQVQEDLQFDGSTTKYPSCAK